MKKELAIIIPAYKKPKSIRRLLTSIEQYTSKDLTQTIVVIDDGSNPDDLKKEYPWITAISSGSVRTGFTATVWRGVLISDAKIVGVLGDDTELITPDTDKLIIDALKCGHGIQFDFIAGLNDGIQEGRAHPFMLKHYWLYGYGYPPVYTHYYGDTELYRISKHHDKWIHVKACRIKHHHPYFKRKGYEADIIEGENTQEDCKIISKNDGSIYKKRIQWWEANNKPRFIPWAIGL